MALRAGSTPPTSAPSGVGAMVVAPGAPSKGPGPVASTRAAWRLPSSACRKGAASVAGIAGATRTIVPALTGDGEIELAIPRDRAGTFDPVLVPKGVTRLDGFDDKVISLYARGLSVREIQAHLKELDSTEVSPDLISRVTDAVLDEVAAWQNRPLEAVYPIVFFDALRVKVRDEGMVRNKAVYVALALDTAGQKHVLGLWIEQTEGAKFWLRVMNELKTRGLNDILIAVVDGLKGFRRRLARFILRRRFRPASCT